MARNGASDATRGFPPAAATDDPTREPGTTGGQPFASSSVIVLAPCPRCGTTSPVDTMSCPSCGAELGGETVLNDVHAVETVLLAARGPSATTSHTDTAPDAEAFRSEPPTKARAPSVSVPPMLVDRDPDDDHVTAEVVPRPAVDDPAPSSGFSSSDPPTRFLRGTDDHIELPSGSVVDDFEVDTKLGEGAMGVVYGARHLKLGRRVALKVMAPRLGADPQAFARFEREARALASLHHPNVVDVFAFGALPDGRSYFCMEYLAGEALDERLGRGRVPLDEALDIVDQMARALEAAHAQGVVHRDLKPSNTFLVRLPREYRSVVKLLDYGLAKLAVADGVEKTASGAVIGTALYLSPEQCRSPNVDGRTDIYALGCIAYELVLGRHPFPEARTPTAAIAAHLTQPAPQPRAIWPGIPAALDLLLFSMLAKDPNYRPTLAQVRNVVASVQSPTTTAGRAMRAATEPVTQNAISTRAWMVALVVFALFVGIAIGAKVLGGKSSRSNAPQTPPVGLGEPHPNGKSEAPPSIKSDPPVAAVAPGAMPDASVAPGRAPVADTTKLTKPKPSMGTTVDAAVSDEPSSSAPVAVDAVATGDTSPSSPEGESPAKPEVVERQLAPATSDQAVPRSPSPPTPARSDTRGTLSLDSKPATDVLIDGERKGRTPIVDLRLPVGSHKITLINATYSIKESFPIEIRESPPAKIVKDYRDRIPEAKKPDAKITINPFAKKGSASR